MLNANTVNTAAKAEAIKNADAHLNNAGLATFTELAFLLNEAAHHIVTTNGNRLLRERIQAALESGQAN